MCHRFVQSPNTLQHISPSTVNAFLSNKPRFVGRFLGFPRKDNINFQKGNRVEESVNLFFQTGDVDLSVNIALNKFKEQACKMTGYAKVLPTIDPLCRKAIDFYSKMNEVAKIQTDARCIIQGAEIYCRGDFLFSTVLSDCKITGQTPKEMPQSHKNAAYIYQKAFGREVRYDYFIPLVKETRHVGFEFVCDNFTKELVHGAIEVITKTNNRLEKDPTYIFELVDMFLADPESDFSDFGLKYWIPEFTPKDESSRDD